MNYRAGILFVAVLILSGCAGPEWPGQAHPNPTVEEYTTVKDRWVAASANPPGPAEDAAAITAALKAAHSDIPIREIRWLSPTEAMVQCARPDEIGVSDEVFYGALKKDGNGWRLVAWYSAYFS